MSYKLVRDKHQEIFAGRISGQWRTSPDPLGALVRKLGEEYGEFAEDRDPLELFDMLDVILELKMLLDPLREARDRHNVKWSRFGGFATHLEWHPDPGIDLWEEWDTGKSDLEEK